MEKVDWTGTINNVDRLSTIPNVVKGLKIKPNTCNEVSSEVDLSRFDHVRKIDVGSNAFQNVDHLTMNGLNKLTSFEMGVGSFNGAHGITIGANSLNAMSSVNLTTFSSIDRVTIGENSMNEVSSVVASGLTNLTQFTVKKNSLIIATE